MDDELRALRAPGKLRFHCEVSRGVALLAATEPPSARAARLFERKPCVRYTVRLAPLDVTCPPHLKNFKATCALKLPGLLQGVRRLLEDSTPR